VHLFSERSYYKLSSDSSLSFFIFGVKGAGDRGVGTPVDWDCAASSSSSVVGLEEDCDWSAETDFIDDALDITSFKDADLLDAFFCWEVGAEDVLILREEPVLCVEEVGVGENPLPLLEEGISET
jgi:hypothetical protein